MPNRREFDHIANCKFKVEIADITLPFSEVEGLESITEVEEYADGDDIIIRKRPGRNNCSNIILRRGLTGSTENSNKLWEWRKKVIDGQIERKSGSIVIYSEDGSTDIMRFNFYEAWPCRYRTFVLSALGNGTITEEIELAVEKIERG